MQGIKPHKRKSLISDVFRKKIADLDTGKILHFNFKHLDKRQGQVFEDWEKDTLLAKALHKFHDYSLQNFPCYNDNFKVYGSFPTHSRFTHPPHVPEDAEWASMHVQGKECVIGHMLENTFYIVFLDKEHQFWPTQKG